MKPINFDFIPGPVRRWSPPVIGIPLMLVWAAWGGEAVRFVLFTHHLFWAASIGLLIGPIIETFAARPTKGKVKLAKRKVPAGTRPRAVPHPVSALPRARPEAGHRASAVLRAGDPLPAGARRAKTRTARAQPERAPAAAQTVDEQLAFLRKQRAVVDRNIARLTSETEHNLGSD